MHEHNGISISKVTHATRNYAAKTSRSHGSMTDGTKALGGWMENGSYRAVYDHALPVDALLGAAMFNGWRPESYFLPRDVLGAYDLSPCHLYLLCEAHTLAVSPFPQSPPPNSLAWYSHGSKMPAQTSKPE
jgi:hypothetical protein